MEVKSGQDYFSVNDCCKNKHGQKRKIKHFGTEEIFIFTVDQIVHRQFLHFEHFKGNFFYVEWYIRVMYTVQYLHLCTHK